MTLFCETCKKQIDPLDCQYDFILDRYYFEVECHGEKKFYISKFEFKKTHRLFYPKRISEKPLTQLQKLKAEMKRS